MLKVGLTGGIACGKSIVGEMFAKLGARVIQADVISHALMQPGEPVYEEVVQRFGREILDADGSINRPRLAEMAFGAPGSSAPSRIRELNSIVHPAVIRSQEEWMDEVGRQNPAAVAIVEAALIIEAGAANRFDKLIVVTCGKEARVQRFAARMKISLEAAQAEVTRRLSAQLTEEEKIKAADFVIDNSGSLDATEAQVRQIWQTLDREAKDPQTPA